MVAKPLPSWGPRNGEETTSLYNRCLLEVPQWGRVNMATQPLPSWGPRNGEETTSLYNPRLLGVPTMGESQYGDTTPALLGSPPWEGVQMAT